MSAKRVIPRAVARQDVETAIDHYGQHAGADAAMKFVDALAAAYRIIGTRPATGSPRYGHELDLPGLCSRRIARFPFVVFYVEHANHIDVWRVLHAQRDFAAWLSQGS